MRNARPGQGRSSSHSAAARAGWRRYVQPEVICLVVGMTAGLFLAWTLQPESGWESVLGLCAGLLGPQATAVLAYLPDLVGIAALLAVVGGAAKIVTSAVER